jgi:SAM-dependent methyltransferase
MRGDAIERVHGERFALIVSLMGSAGGSVLDVGCRSKELGDRLGGRARYVGMDLFPPADVIASADEAFPFDRRSFDAVVFADVLEHLENPHDALGEGIRVARQAVVVLLPNMYSLVHRLNFARGRTSPKYRFGADRPLDRHRWLLDFEQADQFTRGVAARHGWSVTRRCAYERPWRRTSARVAHRIARSIASPNLWAWEYAARIEPRR